MMKIERKATFQLERLKAKLKSIILLKERDYLKQETVDCLFHVILLIWFELVFILLLCMRQCQLFLGHFTLF